MYLPEVSNKQKIREKTSFFVGLLKAIEKKSRIRNPVYGSEDPDLYPEKTCSGSRIRTHWSSVLRIRIRDPGLGAFLNPGSGIRDGRKSASGSGIRDEQPGSYFLELFAFFGVKILKFFDEDPGWRQFGSGIRTGKKADPG
jgi:hypothetical protein